MKTAAKYHAMAKECVKWAGEAYTDEVRQPLLQLAQIWLDTASQLDGLPATRIAPIRKWPGYLFLRYRRGRDCVRRGKTGGIIGGGNLRRG
jgi:hypothetical protein